jgi:hypothetical protein
MMPHVLGSMCMFTPVIYVSPMHQHDCDGFGVHAKCGIRWRGLSRFAIVDVCQIHSEHRVKR